MIHYETYKSGKLYGIRYQFESAGDALPEHVHEAPELHNLVVLKGSCDFISRGLTHHLRCGVVFDFDGRIPHRIVACEPTETMSFFLNGEPHEYVNLPASELSGIIQT